MMKKINALQLKALGMAISLAFAPSAFADNDRNHSERNESHSSNHSKNHESHGARSGSSTSKVKIGSRLSGGVEAAVYGKIKLEQSSKKSEFEVELNNVPVPSAALDLTTPADASGATLTLFLTDSTGADYAECNFDISKIKRNRRGVVAYSAEYKIKLTNRNGYVQANAGVCDIDLATDGIQSGVPSIQAGDTAEIIIDTNSAIVAQGQF